MQQMNGIRTIWATAEVMDMVEAVRVAAAPAAVAAVYQHLAIDHMVSFCTKLKRID